MSAKVATELPLTEVSGNAAYSGSEREGEGQLEMGNHSVA